MPRCRAPLRDDAALLLSYRTRPAAARRLLLLPACEHRPARRRHFAALPPATDPAAAYEAQQDGPCRPQLDPQQRELGILDDRTGRVNKQNNYTFDFMGNDWPADCGVACQGSYDTGRYITPAVLQRMYSFDATPSATPALGSMGVAEFEGEFWDPPALDFFSSSCKLPAINIDQNVGAFQPLVCLNGVSCGESMLDIELIAAAGGDIPQTVVYNDEGSFELLAVQMNDMSDEHIPKVMSISWGMDEWAQPVAWSERMDVEWMKLGLRGVSILIASGDAGAWGDMGVLNGHNFRPDSPATSPYVTAVGGTDLKVTDVIGEEQAWSHGGGGFSNYAARPAWQAEAVATYLSTYADQMPPSELFNSSLRAYPDVSALGGGNNPYCMSTLAEVGWQAVYGTSASAPVVAGIIARLNEARLKAGKPVLGFLNPFLYANPDAFNDVVYGDNKGDGYVGYPATVGWDAATGLGTPNYTKLVAAAMVWGPEPSTTSCFARDTSLACTTLDCTERVPMGELRAGDLVATSAGLERLVLNQHVDDHELADLLRIQLSDGSAITVTPDHVIAVDGAFAPASTVAVGSTLSAGTTYPWTPLAVTKVSDTRGGVVNPVTPSGTILVADHAGGAPLLATTHPAWIAPLFLNAYTFPFIATRVVARLAPTSLQAYYTAAEGAIATATPAIKSSVASCSTAWSPAVVLAAVAADGLFVASFLLYTLALPLGAAGAAYLAAVRK